MKAFNSISVIGTGYVGLVTGTCLAEIGYHVICMDYDREKIKKLKNGQIPIFEPGLDEMVKENVANGTLEFSSDYEYTVENSEVIFIAVGTPPQEDGSADLHHVLGAARSIAEHMNGYKVIINKSTVPVGTAKLVEDEVRAELKKCGKTYDFDIVSNPEFLKEGSAVDDFMQPDRIVVGCKSDRAREIMGYMYRPFEVNNHPVVFCENSTAEVIKYASNAFLAVKISFVNELSALSELVGADINKISQAMGLDTRIGKYFLKCGPGYGGSCFPKDTKALCATAEQFGLDMSIVKSAISANENQKRRMVTKIEDAMGGVKGKTIGVLGLAFKPNTDDMREAPAEIIIKALVKKGAKIRAYDPEAMENAKAFTFADTEIYYAKDIKDAVKEVDATVLMTEWNMFKKVDFDKLKTLMKGDMLFDLRNIYVKDEVEAAGLRYISVGR